MEITPVHLSSGDHVVHLYDAEEALADVVGAYLTASVRDGDAVIVIATDEHRRSFASALQASGIDPQAVARDGRLTLVDSREMLSRFMVDELPDTRAFDASVGSLLRTAASQGRPVRAYGEMVATLWEDGNQAGAVQLERLWNDLAQRTPFALFCAYPRAVMGGAGDHEAFHEMCEAHSQVVHGAPLPAGAEAARRFVATSEGARLARRYVTRVLVDWGREEHRDDAVIAIGELAANAISHAGGDFTVGLAHRPDGLRLMVGDTSPEPPVLRNLGSTALGGRGLRMVDALAGAWGWEPCATGKVIWVDLLAPRPAAPDRR